MPEIELEVVFLGLIAHVKPISHVQGFIISRHIKFEKKNHRCGHHKSNFVRTKSNHTFKFNCDV